MHRIYIYIISHAQQQMPIFQVKLKGPTQADMLFGKIYISIFRLDLVNIINFLH